MSGDVLITKQTIREEARRFSARFEDAKSEQAERQTFWNDFFRIFGIDRKQVAAFEELAKRASTNNIGWIDLIYPGHMGVEHKSAGEDLDDAMGQLLDYLPSLPAATHPWLLVACDFQRFEWKNLDNGESGAFKLEDLADNIEIFEWIAGFNKPGESYENTEHANLEATALIAKVHDALKDANYPEHAMREWLTRTLFCLFADDSGIWDRAAFHTYLATRTRADGSDLGGQIAFLFQLLDMPEEVRPENLEEELAQFTYVNGDLFREVLPIPVASAAVRDALLHACSFDWSVISPAVFGSMFQNVMTAAERREIGAHYTTEENILKTIGPLFLDPLEKELEGAKTKPKLEAFLKKLGELTFMDPACGCGNFLVVSYRELRRLEARALRRLLKLQGLEGQWSYDIEVRLQVKVDQFYGIELEEFPAKIARTAMYLIDHQCNREISKEFGHHYVRFPIPAAPHIENANALAIDWNQVLEASKADYVFGNPPFIGMSMMSTEQQRERELVFADLEEKDLRTGRLDYVACWYAKAYKYAEGHPQIELAFVSTNSICQGEQAITMERMLVRRGFQIKFAHRTFSWKSEARGKAAVHVVIVGFGAGEKTAVRLFSYEKVTSQPEEQIVNEINWYLAPAGPLLLGKHRVPIAAVPKLTEGNRPEDGGGLIVSSEEKNQIEKSDPIAAKYIRKLQGAHDLLNGEERFCFWLVGAEPGDVAASSVLKERLAQVRESRIGFVEKTNSDARKRKMRELADKPGLFSAIRQPTSEYLCVPRHSSEARPIVPMALLSPEIIAHDTTLVASNCPKWLFGVLQSQMYMAWLRSIGGRLKSDLRITPDIAYNAFPFVEPEKAAMARLEEAVQEVIGCREKHAAVSLGKLYAVGVMPPDLVDAHRRLDALVDRLYAPRRKGLTEVDRLAVLVERYRRVVRGAELEPVAKESVHVEEPVI